MVSLYKNRCTVSRVTTGANENGEAEKKLTVIHENVPCTLSRKGVAIKSEDPATSTKFIFVLFAPLSIDLKRGDHVIIDGEISFKCQEPFKYKYLKKQEVEVTVWQG